MENRPGRYQVARKEVFQPGNWEMFGKKMAVLATGKGVLEKAARIGMVIRTRRGNV